MSDSNSHSYNDDRKERERKIFPMNFTFPMKFHHPKPTIMLENKNQQTKEVMNKKATATTTTQSVSTPINGTKRTSEKKRRENNSSVKRMNRNKQHMEYESIY